MLQTYNGILFSNKKKKENRKRIINELLIHVATWMYLKNVTLGERSQT